MVRHRSVVCRVDHNTTPCRQLGAGLRPQAVENRHLIAINLQRAEYLLAAAV
jgi:hypothetical protein